MRKILLLMLGILLVQTGCNSVYIKPNTLDTNEVVFADRGGYGMRRSIKQALTERGYHVVVGKASSKETVHDSTHNVDIDTTIVPRNVRYIVKTTERTEMLRPIWCAFNGFWWWNFNVSIADQESGEEIMTWRGRGCVNSSMRMLDRILDDLEK